MDAISLDGIDTTAAWRVESEAPSMEHEFDWLHENLRGRVGGKRDDRGGGGLSRADPFTGGGYWSWDYTTTFIDIDRNSDNIAS